MGHAATAVPAFIGIQDDGWLALLGIWYEDIHLAYVHTCITSVADLRINYQRPVGSRYIGGSVYFSHSNLLTLTNSFVFPKNKTCLSNLENLVKENLNAVLPLMVGFSSTLRG
jgi:hypothetical protein